MYHLIAKDKVVQQYILGKYCNSYCTSFRVITDLLNSKNFKVAITQQFKVQQELYYVIAYQKIDEQHI